VEQVYSLDRIADAEAHVETKHTRGKVVVSLD
jgi:NADPH:quinone reductase-like Zn-dependent oxidoreductase